MFSIDKSRSASSRSLVLRSTTKQLRSEADLQFLSEPIKAIFTLLVAEEKNYRSREKKKNHQVFDFFRLTPKNSYAILQRLASMGALFLDEKKLICDFFSRLPLRFRVDQQSNGLIAVMAELGERTLDGFDLVVQGLPHIAIQGQFLRFIDDEASWSELITATRLFSVEEYEAWQRDISHPLLLQQTITVKEKNALPILQLTDRTMAFAKLLMQYEGITHPYQGKPNEVPWEKDLLDCGYQKKSIGNSQYYCPVNKAAQAIDFLLDVGWTVIDCRGQVFKRLTKIDLHALPEGDHIVIQGVLEFDDEKVDIRKLFDALKKKESNIALSNNKVGFLLRTNPELTLCLDLLEEIEIISDKIYLKKQKFGLVKDLIQSSSLFETVPTSLAALGGGFHGTLRGYQQAGVDWLLFLYEHGFGGILADDMGLGKTVQVIAFLAKLPSEARSLIVVPTSLLYNWQREIAQFFPAATVYVHHGKERELLNGQNASIILTSYGVLRQEIATLEMIPFSCVIVDEGQAIKNSDTKTTQAALRLQARLRVSITGTPIENSLTELWTQFQFLQPGLVTPEDLVPDQLGRLKKKITPFLLRRKKRDVAKELPEKIEQIIFVDMHQDQRKIYERTLESFQKGLLKKIHLDGAKAHSMEILEAILRLRQICCHPALVPQLLIETDAMVSTKCDLVMEDLASLMEEKKGVKVLIFSQFTSMLHLLAREAKERQWSHLLLDGATQNRSVLVDRFQTDPDVQLFFISLKAGGVGLNLTKADYVLIYDPWWNSAAEDQAVDRAHRIGRQEVVISKRYVMKDTIEEQIFKLQHQKKQIADILLEGEKIEEQITLDELTALLS